MNPAEVLRIVDAIHLDKNIGKEIVFEGIEAALISAAKKHYGEEADIQVHIGREDGTISATCDGEPLDSEETVGRIGAQTAKQVMIQKIREAERDALFEEYNELIGDMVSGVIQRYEGGAASITLSNVEAILPRGEQIPGETHHVNERVRATVFEVRKAGSRVKVILSRTRPQLVQRLFEQEIPEIIDGVIEVRALSREPGYRSKIAVVSSDQRVDCVGACVGVRGNRIKNIVDELGGERIDIVRWDENLEVLIPNALQPAEVEQVILCKLLGRAIVLVNEDQLSLAIGRRGQNVRLASKLSGWDIEIMTQDELAESIDRAVGGFSSLEGVKTELAERLVEEGFLSYDDLSIIEPVNLMEMGSISEAETDKIVAQAEAKAEEAEAAAAAARRQKREDDRQAAQKAEAGLTATPEMTADKEESETPDSSNDATSNDATSNDATVDGTTVKGEAVDGDAEANPPDEESPAADCSSEKKEPSEDETDETSDETDETDETSERGDSGDTSASDTPVVEDPR
jgi:N utilization substance protein A